MISRKIEWSKGLFILIFFAYLVVGYFTPLSGDDWMWVSSEGKKLLLSGYANYNGRYLGNTLEIVLTHNTFIRSVVYALTNVGIVYFMYCLNRNKMSFLIMLVLLLTMPVNVYAQTYGWFAGFGNYNTSVCLTLGLILMLKQDKKYFNIAVFVTALCAQLFVEHMTLINVLLASYVMIAKYVYKQTKWRHALSYFLGSIIGAVIMFSNSAYLSILNNDDFYRSVGSTDESLISRMIDTYIYYVNNYLVMNNTFILIVLSGIFLLIMHKTNEVNRYFKMIATFILLFIPLWSVMKKMAGIYTPNLGGLVLYSETLLSIAYLACLFFGLMLVIKSKETLEMSLIYLVCGVASGMPFLVLSPLGPRCFLTTIIFYIMLIGQLLNYYQTQFCKESSHPLNPVTLDYIYKALGSVILLLFGMYMGVSILNHIGEAKRIAEIRADKGKVREFDHLPFVQFTQQSTPYKGTGQEKHFKTYYDLPEETKFDYTRRSVFK